MFQEFKEFISRGNVLDLAVGVIIGAAFGKIVTALTDSVIMPVIGAIFGGLDFSSYFVALGPIPAEMAGSTDYAALKKAGVPLLGYGAFITEVVNFLILAFIVFLIVRTANRALAARKVEEAPAPAVDPADIVLLREIRDLLRQKEG